MDQHHYNFWAVIEPSEIKGVWTAHALDFGVVSQGDSVEHALEMLSEATMMVVMEDLCQGKDPEARRSPQKYYDSLWKSLSCSEKLEDISSKKALSALSVMVNINLTVKLEVRGIKEPTMRPELKAPLTLLVAQEHQARCY